MDEEDSAFRRAQSVGAQKELRSMIIPGQGGGRNSAGGYRGAFGLQLVLGGSRHDVVKQRMRWNNDEV